MIFLQIKFQDEASEERDAMILMFDNDEKAEVFQYYFEEISKQEKAIRDKEEYGNFFKEINPMNGWISYVYKVENCVMYLPVVVGDEVASQYQKAFDTAIKSLKFDKQEFKGDITTAKNDIQPNIKEQVNEYQKSLDESIKQWETAGNNELNTIKSSKNETSINTFKEKYLITGVPIIKDKVNEWTKEIKDLEDKIAVEKKKAEEEKKKAEERAKNTHSAGTYKVGTDIPAGEYYINGSGYFSVNKDGSGDLSSIIVNGNFNNNTIITVTNGQYLTVQRASFMPMAYAPEPDLTHEGMFKVGTHLSAGEYKLKSTSSSYKGYYAVYNSSKQGLSHIVKNSNFDGSTYVTVKKGQYLVLNRCTIEK